MTRSSKTQTAAAAAQVSAHDDEAQARADMFNKLFGDQPVSGKRQLVAVVASIAVSALGGYAAGYVGTVLAVAAAMVTGSVFIAYAVLLIGIIIGVYAAALAGEVVRKYISTGAVDKHLATSRDWLKAKFTRAKPAIEQDYDAAKAAVVNTASAAKRRVMRAA